MNLQCIEYKPSATLSHYIESYWYMRCTGAGKRVSSPGNCIPKGTIELIFLLEGANSEVLDDEEWKPLPRVMIAGIQTRIVTTRMYAGSAKFGIRLKPETFIAIFGRPVADIYQKFCSLNELFGNRYDWLVACILEAPGNEERITMIESFLRKKIAGAKAINNVVTEAIRKIWDYEGNITTSMLSKLVYIGERQLQRLFKEATGTSPKLYSRIVRFRSAYLRGQLGNLSAWTDVAYNLGYTDQAHFVKEFKSFAGLTPTAMFS